MFLQEIFHFSFTSFQLTQRYQNNDKNISAIYYNFVKL
jgi:hypothetical protein